VSGRPTTDVRCWPVFSVLAVLLLLAWVDVASAQSAPAIVRVEEDWELVVGDADPASDAPQVTCVISPNGSFDSLHATFVVNEQSLPIYEAGGLQLQLWEGEVPLTDRRFPNGNILSTAGEVIRWTQALELSGGMLTFEITDGTSTTWGSFGGQGYLKSSIATSLADLNAYDPAVSVEHSGVSYAGNRVVWLALKCVRAYTATGEEVEDATVRVVHSHQ